MLWSISAGSKCTNEARIKQCETISRDHWRYESSFSDTSYSCVSKTQRKSAEPGVSFQVRFLLSAPLDDCWSSGSWEEFHFCDVVFVSLSSAYTGNPKGVMLTHGNVVADFSGFLKVTDVGDPLFLFPLYRKSFKLPPRYHPCFGMI